MKFNFKYLKRSLGNIYALIIIIINIYEKKNNNIYAWGCDFENFRGEGILGVKFLRQLSNVSKRKIFVESPTKSFFLIYKNKISKVKTVNKKNINFSFFYNYIYPFYGF